MYKFLAAFCLIGVLSGCAFVHKMDVEQGNVFCDDMVQHLHRGMTREQVKEIMGSSTLINTFDDNRLSYVYTYQPGGGKRTEKQVTLVFSRGILREIIVNKYCDF